MGKIDQNPKIGQFWRPVAPQPYVAKKADRPRKFPGHWTTTGSKQYLSAVHPLTCILLWVRCLFDPLQDFQVWGFFWRQMTPECKHFINFCPKSAFQPRFTCHGQIWWNRLLRSCRKVVRYNADKKPTSGTCPGPPLRPQLADRAQNFADVVSSWAVHVYRLWSGSAAVCRTYLTVVWPVL